MRSIDIVRASIERVTRMLSGSAIKVTQEGSQAFVGYNRTTRKPEVLNVPFLPDNASETLIAAVQGFLDHEVAHLLFSDYDGMWGEFDTDSKLVKHFTNVIEDCRIERRMAERFDGSAYNLEQVQGWVIKDSAEALERLSETGSEAELFRGLSFCVFRAWAGQKPFIEMMKPYWDKVANIAALVEFAKAELPLLKDSADARALSLRVVAAIEEAGKEKEKAEEKAEPEESESADECETGSEGDKPEGEESGSPDSGGEGDESGDDESKDDEDESDDESDDESGGEDSESESAEAARELMEAGVDEEDAFSKAVAASIEDAYRDGVSRGDWLVFSEEMTKTVDYKTKAHKMSDIERRVSDVVGPIQITLERVLNSRNKHHYQAGLRSGRLSTANLHRVAAHDDRIFRRKIETKAKNTAVSVLVDFSGSMRSRLQTAVMSALSVSQAMERCRIPCEVLGFSTRRADRPLTERMRADERRLGRRYSTQEINMLYVLKTFSERHNSQVIDRFASAAYDQEILSENIDPLAVLETAKRLLLRPEQRKVLIVFSDGAPAFNGDYAAANSELKKVIKRLEGVGVETLGIGIQTDSVRRFYDKFAVVNDIKDLPSVVVKEVSQLLTK